MCSSVLFNVDSKIFSSISLLFFFFLECPAVSVIDIKVRTSHVKRGPDVGTVRRLHRNFACQLKELPSILKSTKTDCIKNPPYFSWVEQNFMLSG